MSKPITFLKAFWCVLISLTVLGCQKVSVEENIGEIADKNYITEQIASLNALELSKEIFTEANSNKNKAASTKSVPSRSISSTHPVKSKNGLNVFYIINFEKGGWAIISADKRTMPLLAYSERSSFQTQKIPSGLDDWLEAQRIGIEKIRELNLPYTGQDKVLLNNYSNYKTGPVVKDIPPDDGCSDTFEEMGPYIQTTWGQTGGYNNLMPSLSCVPWYNYGRAFTGCVATAMAQVIRHHQYPTNWYNYGIMPNIVNSGNINTTGTNEVAKIMYDAASSVSSSYFCDGTGANTQEDVPSALINFFGYSTTTRYLDYSGTANYQVVESELRSGRPVIFRGGRKDNWFVFPIYVDGHAWVSDGFKRSFFCESGASYLYFHMNWGWDSMHNGWYAFNNFNPGNDTFNYKSGVIVGIKP